MTTTPLEGHAPRVVTVALGLGALATLCLAALASTLGAPAMLAPLAVAAALLGLRLPLVAICYLMVFTFFRLAIPPGTFAVDPFLPAFGGVLVAAYVWPGTRPVRLPAVDAVGAAIGLYILWVLVSALTPHLYPAGLLGDESFSVPRFIVIGVVMPLVMHLVGRSLILTESRVRAVLWMLVTSGAYSALVSVLQFTGPSRIVWPRYIVEAPAWEGRANGAFNQPVVNGLVLIIGFLAAILLAAHASEPRALRFFAGAVAVGSTWAIYLTHTRAVWLSFALVLIIGAVTAAGFRKGFVLCLVTIAVGVALKWSTFTSADRDAGGVGSAGEVQDRLNTMATSFWAFDHKPWSGWGIGRFPAVNTYHHQAWSPEVPWERGFGIASHFDALGVLAELGIVGLGLWMTVLVLVATQLVRAVRRLPPQGLANRPFALTAAMAFVALVVAGTTVDLRLFDFPNIVVWMLAGAAIGRARLSAVPRAERPGLHLGHDGSARSTLVAR